MISRFLLMAVLLSLVSVPVGAELKVESDDDKAIYLVGLSMAQQLSQLHLTEREAAIVGQALLDFHKGSMLDIDPEVYGPRIAALQQLRAKNAAMIEEKKSLAFLAELGKKSGAKVTESGLIYTQVRAGSGAQPTGAQTVEVHYEGRLMDGSIFDSSIARGEPAKFPLSGVIACWTEGVAMMKVGGKATLVCPPEIAYGDRGAPPRIPPGAALTFEVELISIIE